MITAEKRRGERRDVSPPVEVSLPSMGTNILPYMGPLLSFEDLPRKVAPPSLFSLVTVGYFLALFGPLGTWDFPRYISACPY